MVHLSSSLLVSLCLLALQVAAVPVPTGSPRPSRLSARQFDTPDGITLDFPDFTTPGGSGPTKPPVSSDAPNSDFSTPEPASADGAGSPPDFSGGAGPDDRTGDDPGSARPTTDDRPDKDTAPVKGAGKSKKDPPSQGQPDLPKKGVKGTGDGSEAATAKAD